MRSIHFPCRKSGTRVPLSFVPHYPTRHCLQPLLSILLVFFAVSCTPPCAATSSLSEYTSSAAGNVCDLNGGVGIISMVDAAVDTQTGAPLRMFSTCRYLFTPSSGSLFWHTQPILLGNQVANLPASCFLPLQAMVQHPSQNTLFVICNAVNASASSAAQTAAAATAMPAVLKIELADSSNPVYTSLNIGTCRQPISIAVDGRATPYATTVYMSCAGSTTGGAGSVGTYVLSSGASTFTRVLSDQCALSLAFHTSDQVYGNCWPSTGSQRGASSYMVAFTNATSSVVSTTGASGCGQSVATDPSTGNRYIICSDGVYALAATGTAASLVVGTDTGNCPGASSVALDLVVSSLYVSCSASYASKTLIVVTPGTGEALGITPGNVCVANTVFVPPSFGSVVMGECAVSGESISRIHGASDCANPRRVIALVGGDVTTEGALLVSCVGSTQPGGNAVKLFLGNIGQIYYPLPDGTPVSQPCSALEIPANPLATSGAIALACGTVIRFYAFPLAIPAANPLLTLSLTSGQCSTAITLMDLQGESIYFRCDGKWDTTTTVPTMLIAPKALSIDLVWAASGFLFTTPVSTAGYACSQFNMLRAFGSLLFLQCESGVIVIDTSSSNAASMLVSSTLCQQPIDNGPDFAYRPLAVDFIIGTLYVGCSGTSSVTATTYLFSLGDGTSTYLYSSFYSVLNLGSGLTTIKAVAALDGYGFVLPVEGGTVAINNGALQDWGGVLSYDCNDARETALDVVSRVAWSSCVEPQNPHLLAVTTNFLCPLGFEWHAGFCNPCQIGYARNLTLSQAGYRLCQACGVGTVAALPGLANCQLCPAGTAATSPYLACQTCSAGYYSSAAGSTSCQPCLAGYYGSTTGLTSSTCSGPAPAGYWTPTGSTSGTKFPCGSASVYCPQGSAAPIQVLPGQRSLPSPAGLAFLAANQPSLAAIVAGSVQPCPIGSSCDGSGLSHLCEAGFYANTTGLSACMACQAGYMSANPNATSCTACGNGTYSSSSGSTQCLSCLPGYIVGSMGATVCSACSAGKFAEQPGSSSCASCPIGTVSIVNASSFCSACPAGSQPVSAAAAAACSPCPLGSANGGGAGFCSPCSAGTFSNVTGASTCLRCSPGKYSSITNSTTCTDCSPGTYVTESGAAQCQLCLPGMYANLNGSAACSQCGLGQYAASPGLSSCSNCSAGTTASQLGSVFCSVCAAGSVSSQNATVCIPCSAGRFATFGATACTDCLVGTFGNSSQQAACVSCLPGQFQNAVGATVCKQCQNGTYSSSPGTSTCLLCLPGFAVNKTAATTCDACTPGTIAAAAGSSQCSACAEGSIAPDPGSSFCTTCPAGSSNILGNATACVPCALGRFNGGGGGACSPCSAGSFSNTTGSSACQSCAAGHFASGTNSTICLQCRAGNYASDVGSINCLPCFPGTFTNQTGSRSCTACSVGSVATPSGSVNCTVCTGDSIASSAGSIFCSDCGPGFESSLNHDQCHSCTPGRFNSGGSNSTGCAECPTGRFAAAAAAAVCEMCQPGSAQPATGQVNCTLCAIGMFASAAGQPACTPCGSRGLASTPGQSFCSPCSPGTEPGPDPLTQALVCRPCLAGAASTNGTRCLLCAPGYFSVEDGALACTTCSPGRAQPVAGSTSCTACQIGSIASGTAATQCEACPPQSETAQGDGTGNSFCSLCKAGYDRVSNSSLCSPCPIGFATFGGGERCVAVPIGFYADATAAIAPTACSAGRFQNVSGSSFCYDCEAGKVQARTGAARCDVCSSGQVAVTSGLAACESCTKGRFSSPGQAANPCLECEPGTVAATLGLAACDPCAPGQSQSSVGQSSCDFCAVGKYSTVAGAVNCTSCGDGEYAPQTGSSACLECLAGSYRSVILEAELQQLSNSIIGNSVGNASSCLPCSRGKYQRASGKSFCTACEQGKYAPLAGQSNCLDCLAPNVVNPNATECIALPSCQINHEYDVASASCKVCALGTSAPIGSQGCSICLLNSYTPAPGDSCVPCSQPNMDGLQCVGGRISVQAGYFAYTVPVEVNDDTSVQQDNVTTTVGRIQYQYRTTVCPPGMCGAAQLQQEVSAVSNVTSATAAAVTQCEYPRVSSPLCGECAEADGYIAWGNRCSHCESTNWFLVAICLLVSYALVLFFLVHDSSSASYLDVLIYFLQISVLMTGSSASTWIAWAGFANFSPSSSTTDCLAPWSIYQQKMVEIAMPLILIAELTSILVLHLLVYLILSAVAWLSSRCCASTNCSKQLESWSTSISLSSALRFRYYACGLLLLNFSYTGVASAAIEYLRCVSVGPSDNVVFNRPSMHCDSSDYRFHLTFVLLALIGFVAVYPFLAIAFLYCNKRRCLDASTLLVTAAASGEEVKDVSGKAGHHHHHHNHHHKKKAKKHGNEALPPIIDDSETDAGPPSSPGQALKEIKKHPSHSSKSKAVSHWTSTRTERAFAFGASFGPLFISYRSRAWWWSSGVLLRRAILSTVSALVPQPTIRFMALAFVHLYTLILHVHVLPLTSTALNHAETISQTLLVTIAVLLTAHASDYASDLGLQIAIFLLIVPFSLLLACTLIGALSPKLFRLAAQGWQSINGYCTTCRRGSNAVEDAGDEAAVKLENVCTDSPIAPVSSLPQLSFSDSDILHPDASATLPGMLSQATQETGLDQNNAAADSVSPDSPARAGRMPSSSKVRIKFFTSLTSSEPVIKVDTSETPVS